MKDKSSIEVVRKVYDDQEGVCIDVGPGEEGYVIQIKTTDSASIEYFGKIDFLLVGKEFAINLGKAIIAAAEEMR